MQRRRVRRGASFAAVCVTAGLISGIAAPAAAVGPRTLSIAPTSPVANNTLVTVSGSGFNPGQSVAVAQCLSGAVGQQSCDLSNVAVTTTWNDGTFAVAITVKQLISTASGSADCSVAGACILGAAELNDILNTGVSIPVEVGASAPPVRGTVHIPGGLTGWSAPPMSGDGWAAYTVVSVAQCDVAATIIGFECFGSYEYFTDANGHWETDGFYLSQDGPNSDCLVDAGSCVLIAQDGRDPQQTNVVIPLTLSAPQIGSISATPSSGLHHLDLVTINGSGWSPYRSVTLTECFASCDMGVIDIGTAMVESDGTFSIGVDALRFVYQSPVCGADTSLCTVFADDDAAPATTPPHADLGFTSLGAPTRGTLSIDDPLVPFPQQSIDVDLAEWAPEAPITVGVCPTGRYSLTDCSADVFDFGTTGAISHLSLYVAGGAQGTDCTVVGACEIAAWDGRDVAGTAAVQAFSLAPAPVGSVVVTPTTGLTDQTVTVSGAGWPANYYVYVSQCSTSGASCVGSRFAQWAYTDATGSFSTTASVHTSIPDGSGWFVDCTAPGAACQLQVAYISPSGVHYTSTALSFTSTSFSATSNYSAAELAVVQAGAAELGVSLAEFQRVSSLAATWITLVTRGSAVIPMTPNVGSNTLTTTYPNFEYALLNQYAAYRNETVDEYQHDSTLIIASILSLS